MARVENKRITLSKPKLSEWKGHPTLTLNPDGRTNMAFGLGKGMIILENLHAVCAFLKSDGKSLELDAETTARINEFAKEFLPKE